MLERIKENMAVDYLEAECRLMVGDIRIWSGRYVTTFQKNLLPPPRRCVMINDSRIYCRFEAADSCDTSIRLQDDTASNPKIVITAVKKIRHSLV